MLCTQREKGAPDIKVYGYAVAVSAGDKVYAFGVENDWNARTSIEDQINVYVLNTVSLSWRSLPPVTTTRGELPPEVPCIRHGHTAVFIDGIAYLWGGQNNRDELCSNVLYAFDVNAHRWIKTEVSGTVPARRHHHSACVLGKVMYVYGGDTQDGPTNDIYKLDTSTMAWSLINTRGPLRPPSSAHSATIIGTKMFVFGGWGDEVHLSSSIYDFLSVFDTETDCWARLNTPDDEYLPLARIYHSAFAYDGELYIFGGENVEEFQDLWKFRPETLSWKVVEPKGDDTDEPRSDYACVLHVCYHSCCCVVGSCVFIFGGFSSSNHDLCILDFSPSLKTLCKLAVIQNELDQSELPPIMRRELAAMTDGESTELLRATEP